MDVCKLSDINMLEIVFVDSSVLTYHLLNDLLYGKSSRDFIGRVETGEIKGFISTRVVSETIFNFIKAAVMVKHNLKANETIRFLKDNPYVIKTVNLNKPRELFSLFKILPVTETTIDLSYDIISKYSLLPSDAVHLATMNIHGITNLASNDSDFERVNCIRLYKPEI